jgi:hypothetical protein
MVARGLRAAIAMVLPPEAKDLGLTQITRLPKVATGAEWVPGTFMFN